MTDMPILFPWSEYWWVYFAFIGFVFAMLALDLGVFHKNSHAVSMKEASIWSVVWVGLALLFNFGLHEYAHAEFLSSERLRAISGFTPELAKQWADQISLEFLTGYVIEKSLSVDNLFVFVIVFQYFAIKPIYQHRILFYGILGALIFRAIFISIGSALMQYEWIVMIFGVFLIVTGVKLALSNNQEIEPEKNILIRLLRKIMPVTTSITGPEFLKKIDGRWVATPLLLCLVFVEATDIVFAVDSVPAIFAITKEPLIVFTSNVFAILGLRSLYFLLANVVDKFHLLKYGLAVVLVFVGLKMTWLNHAFNGKFPISWSLWIIFGVIGASIAASFAFPAKEHPKKPA
ncbi:MAG: TerC family protein [Bdellovibrionaceae bacterium]|nr:TerC family protein [Pseudobdellovibrionaceae bacterium]